MLPPRYFARTVLCYSLSGNAVDLLTVTNFDSSLSAIQQREYVVITCRVHPGETPASWVCKGLLDFLLSAHPLSTLLRNFFVFKFIPMLNVDGVVNGSYRCSLAGVDLNRCWERPSRVLHPTIWHAKWVLAQLA